MIINNQSKDLARGTDPQQLGTLVAEMVLNSSHPFAVALRQAIVDQLVTDGPIVKAETDSDIDDGSWLTNEDVMDYLGISLRTLQTLRSNGTLPYSKVGKKVFYLERDVKRLVKDGYTMYRLKNPDGYGAQR